MGSAVYLFLVYKDPSYLCNFEALNCRYQFNPILFAL